MMLSGDLFTEGDSSLKGNTTRENKILVVLTFNSTQGD
jgi:hypothetical protein